MTHHTDLIPFIQNDEAACSSSKPTLNGQCTKSYVEEWTEKRTKHSFYQKDFDLIDVFYHTSPLDKVVATYTTGTTDFLISFILPLHFHSLKYVCGAHFFPACSVFIHISLFVGKGVYT